MWAICSDVAEHYDEKAKKYDRAFKQFYWKISDTITWDYLDRYLPQNPNSVVLDAAGGTARWAIPIAKRGYKVVLVDLSQGMLDVAKRKIREQRLDKSISLIKGDMTHIEYPDEFFDFILCFTDALPLAEEIDKTVQEFRRVMKKDSYLFADLINRFGLLMPHVSGDPYNATKVTALIDRLETETSIAGKSTRGKEFRWLWHFPEEAKELFTRNNLHVEKLIGKPTTLLWRNPLLVHRGQDLKASKRLFNGILRLERALCEEPTLLGMAAKFMIIARK